MYWWFLLGFVLSHFFGITSSFTLFTRVYMSLCLFFKFILQVAIWEFKENSPIYWMKTGKSLSFLLFGFIFQGYCWFCSSLSLLFHAGLFSKEVRPLLLSSPGLENQSAMKSFERWLSDRSQFAKVIFFNDSSNKSNWFFFSLFTEKFHLNPFNAAHLVTHLINGMQFDSKEKFTSDLLIVQLYNTEEIQF